MANLYQDSIAAGSSATISSIAAGAVVGLVHTKGLAADMDASGSDDWVEVYRGDEPHLRYGAELRVVGTKLRLRNLDPDNANAVCVDEG